MSVPASKISTFFETFKFKNKRTYSELQGVASGTVGVFKPYGPVICTQATVGQGDG